MKFATWKHYNGEWLVRTKRRNKPGDQVTTKRLDGFTERVRLGARVKGHLFRVDRTPRKQRADTKAVLAVPVDRNDSAEPIEI